MERLRIDLIDECTSFVPGAPIIGVASWNARSTPEFAEIRLFWHTRGKGETDVRIEARHRWERPELTCADDFRLVTPSRPYSYEGRLVTIAWGLELVLDGEEQAARIDLVIAPNGTAVTA